VKTRIPAFGPILIAAAFAPLSLHGQSADSLASDHPVPDCAARESGNARPFDKSRPEALVGRYELTMVSAWEEAAGRWSRGELEIWKTSRGLVHAASDIDLDSLRVPGIPIDDSSGWLGSGDLASRDTLSPGLVYLIPNFLLGVLGHDGSMSWLEVDSLGDGGFWGRWDSDLGSISFVDEEGRIMTNPHGTFCAVSVRESDGAGTDQGPVPVVGCYSDHGGAQRSIVLEQLFDPSLLDWKNAVDLSGEDPSQLQLITNDSICQQISALA
jgi:hypothetical protein